MAEKHARILGELATFGLDLARKLRDQGMAAETPEETANLARAFHGVARSVRQTLALEARLARDAQRQDREYRDEAEQQARRERAAAERLAQAPINDRKNRISSALERAVWSEYEDDEAESLFDDVYGRLCDEAETPDFLRQPIDDQIARLCAEFDLTPPPRRPPPPNPESPPAILGDWNDPPPSPDHGTANGAHPSPSG
jgi:hypothetical protein